MEYLVSYNSYGDHETTEFKEVSDAIRFIQGSLNSEGYSDFVLFKEIPFQVTVNIS